MNRHSRLAPLLLVGVLVLFTILSIPYIQRGYLVDDTFIHLTFARNLRALGELSFNPGEPVYGATSPLWVSMLATLSYLSDDLPTLCKWLSLGFGLASVVVFWLIATQSLSNSHFGLAASLVLITDPYFLRWTNSGMETSLSVLLVLLTVYLHMKERGSNRAWRWAPVAAGLAYLARPECAILLPILVCDAIAQSPDRKRGLTTALLGVAGFLAVTAPWLRYATATFGSIIPATSVAKGAYQPLFSQALSTLVRALKTLAFTHAIPGALILITLAILTVRKGLQRLKHLWRGHLWVWAWILGLLGFYVAGGNIVSRYVLMVTPLITVYAFLCLLYLAEVDHLAPFRGRAGISVAVLGGVLVILNLGTSWSIVLPVIESRYLENMTLVGQWLKENTSETSAVAADEIGIIGFYAERRIVDLEGLITPEIVPYKYRRRDIAAPDVPLKGATFRFLELERPDYLVHQASQQYSLLSTALGRSVFEPVLSYAHAQNMLAYAYSRPYSLKYVNLYRCHWDRVALENGYSATHFVGRELR